MVASQRWWLPPAGIVVLLAGCSYEPAPQPRGKDVAPSPSPTASPASTGTAQTPQPVPSQGSPTASTPPSGPSSGLPTGTPAPADLPVQLSAGVALAQTTLDGTQMGFSVDYQYRGAATFPLAADWVIQRPAGAPARLRVQLQAKGNLATFVRWPPGEGPYQCRIEDANGRLLSATESLR